VRAIANDGKIVVFSSHALMAIGPCCERLRAMVSRMKSDVALDRQINKLT
jgi:ABC-type Na+ transport system ATPase subunit NatA